MDKEEKQTILIIAAFGVAIVLAVLAAMYLLESYKCGSYSEMTGLETKFVFVDGCYVKTDKGWFLKEQIRDINPNQD
jgi:hypothetical protein